MIEPLTGGMVMAPDPVNLKPGELQNIQNGFYYPDDDGLYYRPGSVYLSSNPEALRHCQVLDAPFTDSSHYIVAQACTTSATGYYNFAPVTGATAFGDPWYRPVIGTWATTTNRMACVTGYNLVGTNANNRWYMFNGVTPAVFEQANNVPAGAQFRTPGLLPIAAGFSATATAGSDFSVASASGYYEYWYTEVLSLPNSDQLESAFSGTPSTIFVSATTGTCPQLTLPTLPLNTGVTTYRVYRSPVKAAAGATQFPIGTKVAEVGLGAVWKDTNISANTADLVPGTTGLTGAGWVVANVTAVTAVDAAFATLTRSGITGWATANPLVSCLQFKNFGFSGITGDITGIKVTINAKASSTSNCLLAVGLGLDSGSTTTGIMGVNGIHYDGTSSNDPNGGRDALSGQMNIGTSTNETALSSYSFLAQPMHYVEYNHGFMGTTTANFTLGSSTDSLGYGPFKWKDTDFSSQWSIYLLGAFSTTSASGDTIQVDKVSVTVYYTSGATQADNVPYPIVSLSIEGEEAEDSANLPPPVSSTGTYVYGSLVVDDVHEQGIIKYSMPGDPEYFPELFYLPLDDSFNAKITYIGKVGQTCIVGTDSAIYRLNYLPSESDPNVNRGQAVTKIAGYCGIAHSKAACNVEIPGRPPEIVFVGRTGFYATDGYNIRNAGLDLAWQNSISGVGGILNGNPLVDPSGFRYSPCLAVLNDPGTQTIRIMGYTLDISASYSERHLKPGAQLKWNGYGYITEYTNNLTAYLSDAIVVNFSGCHTVIYSRTFVSTGGSSIVREAPGTQLMSSAPFKPMSWTTRRIFPAGLGKQARLNDLWIYGKSYYSTAQTQIYNQINARRDHYPPNGTFSIEQIYVNADAGFVSVTGTIPYINDITESNTTFPLQALPIGAVNADGFTISWTSLAQGTGTIPNAHYNLYLDVEDGGESKRA